MRFIFKDKLKSYMLVTALGVLAGLAVIVFIELPDNSLWSFYYWSSSTFGFWMFSTSLLVLYSENRKCASVNAGIYIFLMFFITTAHQSFRLYQSGAAHFKSLTELAINSLPGWLLYSIPPALICAMLGIVMWYGRNDTTWGKILRLMPAAFLLTETIMLFYVVFTSGTRLFSALTDLACLIAYLIFLSHQTNHPQQT